MYPIEAVRKYRDAIESRLLIDGSVSLSDDELTRCLGTCAAGPQLIIWSKILRDAGELTLPMKEQ